MSSFLYSSAAAKVVPEGLSPLPSRVPITHTGKKAMDSPTSPDLIINPLEHKLSDDLIKPMLNTFDQKIRLNPGFISPPPAGDYHSPNGAAGHTNEEDYDKLHRAIGSGVYQSPASPEGGLWPKYTELDDRPSSPFVKQMNRERPPRPSVEGPEGTQAIREPAYLLADRLPSPSSMKSEKTQAIREPACQDTGPGTNCPSSPPYLNPIKPARTQAIREAGYQRLPCQASSGPKTQTEAALFEASGQVDDKLSGGMKENYSSSARGKLPSVLEESESFSRREFGADGLLYMSTHSSANHAANFAMHSSYNHSNFSSKLPSYHHHNRPNVTLRTHSSYPPNNFTSKSAPAGSAARTRSTFAMFRRGSSEGGKLGGQVVYRRQKLRKSRSLGHTLLWPLVKIRDGYVGCMMGIEGTGDLSGMAQGGSYATTARYFADVPLSKSDSRNHG